MGWIAESSVTALMLMDVTRSTAPVTASQAGQVSSHPKTLCVLPSASKI